MIILLTGPTAVGKTNMSIKLAKKYNAIIINADATSVYKDLNIGSAKITEKEMDGIKHYLLNIKNLDEDYSVADYQKDGRKILEENKDKNVIIVGGSGLYIKSLLYNYEFEEKENDLYEDKTNEELYKLVLEKDKNVDIHINNRVRMINFLNNNEVHYNKNEKLYDFIGICLTMDRDKLYERVNQRVDKMFDLGLVNEVKDLYQKYPNSNILKRAIGYKEIIAYLNNEIALDETKELIKKNTRHFVKRQYTWFNNQMELKYFDVLHDNTYEEIISFIDSLNSK